MLPSNTCLNSEPTSIFKSTGKYLDTGTNQQSLNTLIGIHKDLELSCDNLLSRQDELIKGIRMNCDRANLYSCKRRGSKSSDVGGDQAEEGSVKVELNFHQEIRAINQLELQVVSLQAKIQEVELSILERQANSVAEAIQKMQFLCGILVVCDGLELEDYIIAISEAAQFIGRSLPSDVD